MTRELLHGAVHFRVDVKFYITSMVYKVRKTWTCPASMQAIVSRHDGSAGSGCDDGRNHVLIQVPGLHCASLCVTVKIKPSSHTDNEDNSHLNRGCHHFGTS